VTGPRTNSLIQSLATDLLQGLTGGQRRNAQGIQHGSLRKDPQCGERGIRTPKPLRAPVFKTGAIAVLPALQKCAIVPSRPWRDENPRSERRSERDRSASPPPRFLYSIYTTIRQISTRCMILAGRAFDYCRSRKKGDPEVFLTRVRKHPSHVPTWRSRYSVFQLCSFRRRLLTPMVPLHDSCQVFCREECVIGYPRCARMTPAIATVPPTRKVPVILYWRKMTDRSVATTG
jgi:hypothetical protein